MNEEFDSIEENIEQTEDEFGLLDEEVDTKPIDELNDEAILEASNETSEGLEEEVLENEKLNVFQKIKKFWNRLSKKGKIIVICLLVLIIAAITTIVILLVRKDKPEIKEEKVEEKIVIEDNYRYENGSLIFVDSDGNELGSYKCDNEDEKLCYVAFITKDDDFDIPKKVGTDGIELNLRTKIYANKYVFINDAKDTNSLIKLYNIEDKKEEDSYQVVKSYNIDYDYVVLKNTEGKYGLVEITKDGLRSLIDFKYDYIGIYDEGNTSKAVIKKEGRYYISDFSGNIKSSAFKDQIAGYNDSYVKTKSNGNYYLYSYDGDEIKSRVKYIYLLDDYYFYVDDDNKLYGLDYENNKLYEEGIKLENDDYVPINTYDENGLKTNSKYAAIFILGSEGINVGIYDGSNDGKITEITFDDYKLNKELSFYNYFKGKLYFYSDENKEEVIGVYTCQKENTDGLNNCSPAKDDDESRNSMIPIYNNKYVFIKDYIEGEDELIKLYDLQKSKEIGNYKSINTNTLDNDGELEHVSSSSALVIAKSSKSGNYGIIEISDSGISTVYDFNYTSLEPLGDYLLAKTTTGTYKLLGKTLAEFPDPVIEYNDFGVLTKYNNRYSAYDLDGKELAVRVKYVKLYDKFVAIVDDSNNLSVKNYSGQTILEYIELKNTDFEGENPSFKIRNSGTDFIVSIYDGTSYTEKTYDGSTGTLKEEG